MTRTHFLNLIWGVFSTSVRPKTLFWSDTKTETQIGQYRNRYQNHISKGESSYLLIVWGIFSIKKGPLKPNLLPNLKYFQIIFEDLGLFLSFKNSYPKEEVENMWKIWNWEYRFQKKKFGSNTNIEIGF